MSLLKKIKKFVSSFILLISTLLVSFSLLNLPKVNAQTIQRGLILSPIKTDLEVKPGLSYDLEYNIANDTGDQDYDISIISKTFTASDEDGKPLLEDFSFTDPHREWLEYSQDQFPLKIDERKDVTATLSIPTDAQAGGYLFAIVFAANPLGTDPNQISIEIQTAALLFVNVQGKVQRDLVFSEFQATSVSDNSDDVIKIDGWVDPFFDPVGLELELGVEGRSFIRPEGNILFSENGDDDPIITELNPNQKIILPDSSRTFRFISRPDYLVRFLTGTDDYIDNIKNSDWDELQTKRPFFGSRTMEVKASYLNAEGEVTVKTTKVEVFFFPWKLAILLVIGIVLLVSIYLLTKLGVNKIATRNA